MTHAVSRTYILCHLPLIDQGGLHDVPGDTLVQLAWVRELGNSLPQVFLRGGEAGRELVRYPYLTKDTGMRVYVCV